MFCVFRLFQQLKAKESTQTSQQVGGGSKPKCGKCCLRWCKDIGGAGCGSESKQCNICGKSGHFQSSKLCKGKKKEKSGKIKAAQESDSDTETSSRIVEERTAQLKGGRKSNSIVTKVGLQAWDPEGGGEDQGLHGHWGQEDYPQQKGLVQDQR